MKKLLFFFFLLNCGIIQCSSNEIKPLKCIGFSQKSYTDPETAFDDEDDHESKQCSRVQGCITCVGCSVFAIVAVYSIYSYGTELANQINTTPLTHSTNSTHSLAAIPKAMTLTPAKQNQILHQSSLPPRIPRMQGFIKTRRIHQPRGKR